MKICMLGDSRSVHLRRIVSGLADRGVQVHVVCHKAAAVPGATVERFTIPPANAINLRRWRGRWVHYLRGFIRRFDAVHVHFLHDWGFTPELIDGGCVLASPWGSDIVPPPGETRPTSELIEARRMLLRRAAGVTAWGPSLARMVSEFAGIDAGRIDLLPLGVDVQQFRPLDAAHLASRNGPVVGFFKGFRAVYGPTYLIHAIPRIGEAIPDVRFQFVGDGPQLDLCRALVRSLRVESSVTWTPRTAHAGIPRLIAGWDLTVIPSVCESFGAAALESSAMGVPVVASRVGGLPETVRHDETGLLVEPQDPEAIAEAIVQLLNDTQRRRRMGAAGRSMVAREYEWSDILDKWVRTYAKALDQAAVMV